MKVFTARLPSSRGRRAGDGFTLIELLVVIVILGILAAVVVFAVGGIDDRGEKSAFSADLATLRTAQEAHCAKTGSYATEDELVAAGFLSGPSTMSDVDLLSGGNCGPASNPDSAYLVYPQEPTDDSLVVGTPSDTFNFSGTAAAPGINSNFGMFPYNTNMFETLVRLTPDFQVEPWLAESWDLPGTTPAGASAPLGPMTYRFHLRPGVQFRDGTEMKADSVIYSLNTRTVSNASLKFSTSSAAAVPGDDLAVDVTLTAVNNRLIDQLVHPSIKPIFKVGTVPAVSATNVTAVGTGPFKYLDYTQGVQLLVTRHDTYWGTKARLENLTFRFFSDSNARVLALNAGDVDLIYDVPKDSLASVASTSGLKAAVAPPGANEMIWINSHRPPAAGTSNDALGDVRVRRAVATAIDRASLIAATYPSGAALANTVIPSALLGSHASIVAGPSFDRAAAESLLDSAGWVCAAGVGNPCGAGEIRKKSGVNLRLSLLNGFTPTSLRGDSDILVENALEAVGIDVERTRLGDTSSDQAVYSAALENGDKDLYMERIAQNDANPASAPTNFFDCGGTFGPTGSCPNSALPNYPKNIGPGAAFEALIAQARTATDREVAKQKTAEALREAMDNYVAGVHLASVNWLYGLKKDVDGFVLHGSIRHVRWATVYRSP